MSNTPYNNNPPANIPYNNSPSPNSPPYPPQGQQNPKPRLCRNGCKTWIIYNTRLGQYLDNNTMVQHKCPMWGNNAQQQSNAASPTTPQQQSITPEHQDHVQPSNSQDFTEVINLLRITSAKLDLLAPVNDALSVIANNTKKIADTCTLICEQLEEIDVMSSAELGDETEEEGDELQ